LLRKLRLGKPHAGLS